MMRAAIAVALSTIWISGCGPRAIAVTPDAARLAACPEDQRPFPKLPPLAPMTLADDVRVTGVDGGERLLPAGTEVVLFDVVLDRDEATAVFVVKLRADKARCVSVVGYVREWSAAMDR